MSGYDEAKQSCIFNMLTFFISLCLDNYEIECLVMNIAH